MRTVLAPPGTSLTNDERRPNERDAERGRAAGGDGGGGPGEAIGDRAEARLARPLLRMPVVMADAAVAAGAARRW